MPARISDDERRVLQTLESIDPERESQFNTFYNALAALRMGNLETVLRQLKRKGLVASQGRGRWAQWWITEAGCVLLGVPYKS